MAETATKPPADAKPGEPARRGRRPADESPEAKAKREGEKAARAKVAAAVTAAAEGDGWEVAPADDLIVEEAKVAPFRKLAENLAKLADKAQKRNEGWVRRYFPAETGEQEVRALTSGLRKALSALVTAKGPVGYAIKVEGPVPVAKGTKITRNGEEITTDADLLRYEFRAQAKRQPKSDQNGQG